MPKFSYTATKDDGSFVSQRIEAPTIEAARARLEAEGYVSISFHEEQQSKALRSKLKETYKAHYATESSPEGRLRPQRKDSLGKAIYRSCKKAAIFLVPLLVWNFFSFLEGRPFSIWDWIGFVLTTLFLMFYVWVVLPDIAYKRLIQAFAWRRWPEMRQCIRFIRAIKMIGFVSIPRRELDFREAAALAAEGHLDQALAVVKKLEANAPDKRIYYSRLSDIYEVAGDYENMIACRRMGVQHAPDSLIDRLYLAAGLLRRQRKTSEARNILKTIDESKLADSQKVFLYYCRFLLRVEEKKWQGAHELFSQAVEASHGHPNDLLVNGLIHEMNAYMAIVAASQGLHDFARDFLQVSAGYLKAMKEFELLERCEKHIK